MRILIVDDHAMVREGLKRILLDEFKDASFGEAGNATEALEHAPIGTAVRWETASGIPVTFRVTKTTENENGQCRGFEATAQFASHPDTVRNTACKGQDGAWRTTR